MRFLPFRSRSQVTQQTSELGRSWWEDSTKNSSEIAWSEADSLPPPPPPLPPTPTISHSATQSPNVARVKVCVVDSTNEEHAGRGNGYSSSKYCSDEVDENDDIYEGADGSEDDTVLRWKKSVEMLVAQVSTEEFFDADLGSVMVGTSSEEKEDQSLAAFELEMETFRQLEALRRNARSRNDKRRNDKTLACLLMVILSAIAALGGGLALGIRGGRGKDRSKPGSGDGSISSNAATVVAVDSGNVAARVKRVGPVTTNNMLIQMFGIPHDCSVVPEDLAIFEKEYCRFFVGYYDEPKKKMDVRNFDELRNNVIVFKCVAQVYQPHRRKLLEDESGRNIAPALDLLVLFSQTISYQFPANTPEFHAREIIQAPLGNDTARHGLVQRLRNHPATAAFSSMEDISGVGIAGAAVTGVASASPTAPPTRFPSSRPAEDAGGADRDPKREKKKEKGKKH